jgi:hypothetical protein
VRPFKVVSMSLVMSCAPLVPAVTCCVCRITNVNLKVSSSSLLSLRMKFGDGPREAGSGSWLHSDQPSSSTAGCSKHPEY